MTRGRVSHRKAPKSVLNHPVVDLDTESPRLPQFDKHAKFPTIANWAHRVDKSGHAKPEGKLNKVQKRQLADG